MVVSDIRPVKKSVGAYYNYIFGEAHNGNDERNVDVYGLANVAGFDDPDDMYKMMELERAVNPSKRRKHDAYTLMMSFGDEIDPNSPKDIETAKNVINDTISEAYPNRSAVVALQADGKGGFLHGHVLLNNVDNKGKAMTNGGWVNLKKHVDEASRKHGLTPLTKDKEHEVYDWRVDLASKFKFADSIDDLEGLGISYTSRFRKKDKTTQLTFKFEDGQGKKRVIRGQALAAKLGYEDKNTFCLETLENRWNQQEKQEEIEEQEEQQAKESEVVIADMADLVEEQDEVTEEDTALDFGGLEQEQGLQQGN